MALFKHTKYVVVFVVLVNIAFQLKSLFKDTADDEDSPSLAMASNGKIKVSSARVSAKFPNEAFLSISCPFSLFSSQR